MKKSILINFVILFPFNCYAQLTGNSQEDILFEILGSTLVLLLIITIIIAILNKIEINKNREKKHKEKREKVGIVKYYNGKNESQCNTAVAEESHDDKKSTDRSQMVIASEDVKQANDDKEDGEEQLSSSLESPPKHSSSNSLLDFSELTVLNGILKKAEPDQIVYYRSWKKNDKLLYEFVNNERTRKAINNRSVIIEPFCIKHEDSKSPDASEEIDTIDPGILNEDYSIIKKAIIIYK